MHVVFSSAYDPPNYMEWQTRFLAHTFASVRQQGELTCMLATIRATWDIPELRIVAHAPQKGYVAKNKPAAMNAFVNQYMSNDPTICIIDPDCAFLRALAPVEAKRRYPIAQHSMFMETTYDGISDEGRKILAQYVPLSRIPPVSVPLIIHIDDLVQVAPRWLELAHELYRQAKGMPGLDWVCEMWAYAIASAECELQHTIEPLAWAFTDDTDDAPIVHYSYRASTYVANWDWSKVDYRPWTRIIDIPLELPNPLYRMLNKLDDYAILQSVKKMMAA